MGLKEKGAIQLFLGTVYLINQYEVSGWVLINAHYGFYLVMNQIFSNFLSHVWI